MKLQENINRIKQMMGIIKEDIGNDTEYDDLINKRGTGLNAKIKDLPKYESPYKPCRKCVGSYGGLMNDDCAYEAIERFEENYGTANGTSMGDNYFESNWKNFDSKIVNRIVGLIGDAWDYMGPKFRMQLWSFMYNSDSGGTDLYRWLAILYITASDEITTFDKSITSKIINKKDIKTWENAVKTVSEYSGWNSKYDKFLEMIDGQYKTYSNDNAYNNSWGKRPKVMEDMYDECVKK